MDNMKKYINFRNFGILCFTVIVVMILTSSVTWSTPSTRTCYVEIVKIDGHKYVIATTSAIKDPGICIIHAASCNCNKH